MENKQKLDEKTKNKSAEDYSNKVLNVSSSMNWGVHMYHGNKIQMDTSKAMGEQIVLLWLEKYWSGSRHQTTNLLFI